jgi:hypothetical protein
VVSHDAGGAEILASYVAQNALDCRLVLAGPALEVFQRRLGAIQVHPLVEAIAASDWCLLGSGWQSELEWQALGEAKRLGKRAVTFLDHWVNYPERFERAGERRLPDEIWVGDEDALTLARGHFPDTPVTLVPNPYFDDVQREIARAEAQRPPRGGPGAAVLFVLENLSGHARKRFDDERHFGYTEFDALEYFFSRLGDLGLPIAQITLRPHPTDPRDKYSAVVARHAPLARISSGKSLLEEIAEADVVVGCETMAMLPAVLAGKRVLCSVPPGQRVVFMDKRSGVEMLRDLPTRSTTAA